MDQIMNTLPIQTYVRQRVQTIVTDIAGESSGSVSLSLDKPSNVTVIIASDAFEGCPALFVGAIGRTPTIGDFDMIVSPIDDTFVKGQSKVTLHLPQGATTFQWKSLAAVLSPEAFPAECSLLVLAIDQ